MSRYPTEPVHISLIRVGDAVLHNGKEMTVCVKDMRRDSFMGSLLFGDSYRLGTRLVLRCKIDKATS